MTDAVHFPQIRRSKMRKTLKILLVALLPFCVEAVSVALGNAYSCAVLTDGRVMMLLIALFPFAHAYSYGSNNNNNGGSDQPYHYDPWAGCEYKEACDADDFCAIKHDNSDMITFRGSAYTYSRGVCGDLDGEYFEKPSKFINTYRLDECYICSERRKGRKLLGGPIPPNTDPLNNFGNICCAMKLEECCMPNPYAWSGLPYDAAHQLIITFNVLFWFYVVIIGGYLFRIYYLVQEHKQWWIIMFRELSLITILFWTFPLWFPLYIVPSFGYMIYKRDFSCEGFCMLFDYVVCGNPLND